MKYKILFAEFSTGIVLNPDTKSWHLGPDDPHLYLDFDSIEDAKAFATDTVRNNRHVETSIWDEQDNYIATFSPQTI